MKVSNSYSSELAVIPILATDRGDLSTARKRRLRSSLRPSITMTLISAALIVSAKVEPAIPIDKGFAAGAGTVERWALAVSDTGHLAVLLSSVDDRGEDHLVLADDIAATPGGQPDRAA